VSLHTDVHVSSPAPLLGESCTDILTQEAAASHKAIELEKVSEENVLNAKRIKQKHDYAQLHIQVS
jgi:hypothetical protein